MIAFLHFCGHLGNVFCVDSPDVEVGDHLSAHEGVGDPALCPLLSVDHQGDVVDVLHPGRVQGLDDAGETLRPGINIAISHKIQ